MENIRDAQYGEEVRGSIISGLEKINLETENTTELVETKIVELDASETTRQSNESTRQTNEAARQVEFAQSIEDVTAIVADVERRLENGEFIGATPSHEWNGTNIRFKQGDGTWGPWVNLQGPIGPAGSLENATADRVATTDGTNVQQNLDGLRTDLADVVHMGYDSKGEPLTQEFNGEQLSNSILIAKGKVSVKQPSNETINFMYRRYLDGFVECWTYVTIPANSDSVSVTLPFTFYNASDTDCQVTPIWSEEPFYLHSGGMTSRNSMIASIRGQNGGTAQIRNAKISIKGYLE
ncbi:MULTISPECIES: hypothetical protein [unclassified Breznakia]|uniref:hypothetical protein n=1 Tax=unclassified Breznakia TaxID=2623764 RepID=UPI00247450D4|nr:MULTISPECIES: hypothetical protein [unclassified Breznakia]